MKSTTSSRIPNGHGSLYKEVRFSPTSTPIKRSQSVPNDHPTLIPDHTRSLEMAKETLPALAIGYLEASRSLVDRQRINFDRERILFAEERQLWEKERELLKTRITELEALLKSRGVATATGAGPPTSFPSTSSPSQVWEGSSPMSRPTRVFPDQEKSDSSLNHLHLHPSEQGGSPSLPPPSLDAALSPKSHATELQASIPVPIEKLDSSLDGITLKSSALHPDVVARVMTPPSPSSREPSPTSSSHGRERERPSMDRRNSVKLKLSDLGPPETNLVRDAGHTPMVVIDRDIDTAQGSPGGVLFDEDPLSPPVTRLIQPTERGDSYFAGVDVVDLPDDPALKGPLSLLNEKGHDDDFLQEVDMKLLGQAKQILGHKEKEDEDEDEPENPAGQGTGEEVPEIKFKNTTNFGTAFGRSI
ncbi:uncharacterized protein DSM5745_07021 [Aspergillus mulundensis]|uniref:Uncharacterized protein n=1 Tax=Aspergillus mulundensis TaxID=1810919 RepID=A0A3D8RJY8_9EURO|nr:Uncharacterized protein DSM5745_07021 [Aspergillus mulundensis]RDW74359.1 Uncharacterized protein DSM5745_07021 [Aspergillus mulundensis]